MQGLDAWGRYYGAAVFDPFTGSGYIDQALAGSVDPFVDSLNPSAGLTEPSINPSGFSSFFQGLMLDPALLSGRSRSANLFRRPFLEGSVGGGFVRTGSDWGWTTEGELQGYAASPFPWSFYGKFSGTRTDDLRTSTAPGLAAPNVRFDLRDQDFSGTGYLTARPTPNDRIATYFSASDIRSDFRNALVVPFPPVPPFDAITYDRTVRDRTGAGGVAWSHTWGYHNVSNVALFASGYRRRSNELAVLFADLGAGVVPVGARTVDATTAQTSYLAAANHIVEIGGVTLRYGAEGGKIDQSRLEVSTLFFPATPPAVTTTPAAINVAIARTYLDAVYDVTQTVKIEAALFGTHLGGRGVSITRLEPRLAAAWAPVDGHWLRAGYLRETEAANTTTLAPIGVLGPQSNQVPLGTGGYSDTFAARWDAQWTSRLFTTLDYQHQSLNNLAIPIPGSLTTIDIAAGTLDRVSATANVWLGQGLGAFGTIAYARSRDRDPASPGFGGPLPFIPDYSGRVGVSFVHPSNVKVTVSGTYIGPRAGNVFNDRLPGYWTADAFLTWEPFDKRFELQLGAYNMFNTRFLVAPDMPGWGRTLTGSLKVRF